MTQRQAADTEDHSEYEDGNSPKEHWLSLLGNKDFKLSVGMAEHWNIMGGCGLCFLLPL